jgi:hypothetical protein
VCDGELTVERAISDASLIVVGQVIEIRSRSTDPTPDDDVVTISSCGEEWVRVRVSDVLKGNPATEVVFVRSSIGTSCDFQFPFHEGKQYLLFSFLGSDGATQHLSGCSPSSTKRSATKMIKKIRAQLAGAS